MTKIDAYQQYFYRTFEQFQLDPERAHAGLLKFLTELEKSPLGLQMIKAIAQNGEYQKDHLGLEVQLGSMIFEHPVILAEGFLKNAEAIPAMFAVGFSGVIVGTVTKEPQDPNPGKVMWRLPNGALLNYHGFGNEGMKVVSKKLARTRANMSSQKPIGVSVGMNRGVEPTDAPLAHAEVIHELGPLADFLVINVASPNTAGLRNNLAYEQLSRIVTAAKNELARQGEDKLLLVKLSPDMTWSEIDEVIKVCEEHGCGIVAVNTSKNPELKRRLGVADLPGGVSGPPLFNRAYELLQYVHDRSPELLIIGEGGINSAKRADLMLSGGANLVGVYTGLVTAGPTFPSQLVMDLKGKYGV